MHVNVKEEKKRNVVNISPNRSKNRQCGRLHRTHKLALPCQISAMISILCTPGGAKKPPDKKNAKNCNIYQMFTFGELPYSFPSLIRAKFDISECTVYGISLLCHAKCHYDW